MAVRIPLLLRNAVERGKLWSINIIETLDDR